MTGLIDGSITYNPEPLERPAPGNACMLFPAKRGRHSGSLRGTIFERNGRSPISVRSDIVPGGIFPDYELPDQTGKLLRFRLLKA